MSNVATTSEDMKIAAALLLKLVGLGIKAELTRVEPGPIVTGFHFKPANSVPITKFMNKAEDFALAAGVEKTHIERIGGEIVVFCANKERKYVDFKDYLHWFLTDKDVAEFKIPLAVGIDYTGEKQALDLAEMPHLLMAGSTGSGKSVFESAIISSLAVSRSPDDVKIILMDAKQLDLVLFGDLPHVTRVAKTLEDYHRVMEDVLTLIEKRKATLSGAACQNIHQYRSMGMRMPYLVIMIDEFGEFLEQDRAAKKEKETWVAEKPPVDKYLLRIAQGGRALGVHLIVATQRTSVKVVTGDIKANFPSRISLRLPTAIDSRTILGEEGAEDLLGKGDMFIKFPDSEILRRYHGPFVRMEDIGWIRTNLDDLKRTYEQIRLQQRLGENMGLPKVRSDN